jgi:predicted membrane metal-binding protein
MQPKSDLEHLDPHRSWALALLCGAFFMVLLDKTILLAANPLVVLNEGFQSAFLAVAVLSGIGLVLALLHPGRQAPQERLESLPATGAVR